MLSANCFCFIIFFTSIHLYCDANEKKKDIDNRLRRIWFSKGNQNQRHLSRGSKNAPLNRFQTEDLGVGEMPKHRANKYVRYICLDENNQEVFRKKKLYEPNTLVPKPCRRIQRYWFFKNNRKPSILSKNRKFQRLIKNALNSPMVGSHKLHFIGESENKNLLKHMQLVLDRNKKYWFVKDRNDTYANPYVRKKQHGNKPINKSTQHSTWLERIGENSEKENYNSREAVIRPQKRIRIYWLINDQGKKILRTCWRRNSRKKSERKHSIAINRGNKVENRDTFYCSNSMQVTSLQPVGKKINRRHQSFRKDTGIGSMGKNASWIRASKNKIYSVLRAPDDRIRSTWFLKGNHKIPMSRVFSVRNSDGEQEKQLVSGSHDKRIRRSKIWLGKDESKKRIKLLSPADKSYTNDKDYRNLTKDLVSNSKRIKRLVVASSRKKSQNVTDTVKPSPMDRYINYWFLKGNGKNKKPILNRNLYWVDERKKPHMVVRTTSKNKLTNKVRKFYLDRIRSTWLLNDDDKPPRNRLLPAQNLGGKQKKPHVKSDNKTNSSTDKKKTLPHDRMQKYWFLKGNKQDKVRNREDNKILPNKANKMPFDRMKGTWFVNGDNNTPGNRFLLTQKLGDKQEKPPVKSALGKISLTDKEKILPAYRMQKYWFLKGNKKDKKSISLRNLHWIDDPRQRRFGVRNIKDNKIMPYKAKKVPFDRRKGTWFLNGDNETPSNRFLSTQKSDANGKDRRYMYKTLIWLDERERERDKKNSADRIRKTWFLNEDGEPEIAMPIRRLLPTPKSHRDGIMHTNLTNKDVWRTDRLSKLWFLNENGEPEIIMPTRRLSPTRKSNGDGIKHTNLTNKDVSHTDRYIKTWFLNENGEPEIIMPTRRLSPTRISNGDGIMHTNLTNKHVSHTDRYSKTWLLNENGEPETIIPTRRLSLTRKSNGDGIKHTNLTNKDVSHTDRLSKLWFLNENGKADIIMPTRRLSPTRKSNGDGIKHTNLTNKNVSPTDRYIKTWFLNEDGKPELLIPKRLSSTQKSDRNDKDHHNLIKKLDWIEHRKKTPAPSKTGRKEKGLKKKILPLDRIRSTWFRKDNDKTQFSRSLLPQRLNNYFNSVFNRIIKFGENQSNQEKQKLANSNLAKIDFHGRNDRYLGMQRKRYHKNPDTFLITSADQLRANKKDLSDVDHRIQSIWLLKNKKNHNRKVGHRIFLEPDTVTSVKMNAEDTSYTPQAKWYSRK